MFDQSSRYQVYELGFRQHPGLVVRVRKPSFAGLLALARAERSLGVDLDGATVAGADRMEALAPVVDAFAAALVGWTLVDSGVPVPATREGVYAQDYAFVLRMVLTWHRRVVLRMESEDLSGKTDGTSGVHETSWDLDEDPLASLPFSYGVPDVDPATNEPPVPVG